MVGPSGDILPTDTLSSLAELLGFSPVITTMPSGQLPEELLQQILWHLRLDVYSDTSADDNLTTRKTLLSCMLANSTLRRLAEPTLYHSICQHELARLVQCFISRPRLAGLVRELRDRETDCHEQLSEGLHDIDAWREENIETCELWGRPYEIPPIGFVLLMCLRLETFVIERNACDLTFPHGDFFVECTSLHQQSQTDLGTPLGALRELVMQPGPDYQIAMNEYDDSWLPGLVLLPNIERIEVAELGLYDFEVPPSISSLTSLTVGSPITVDFGYTGHLALSVVLERLLSTCPALQYLDLTFHSQPNEGDDSWDSLGHILNNNGLALRVLHLYNPYEVVMPAHDGTPINLAGMANLRTLTLPCDAVLPSEWSPRHISSSLPARQADDTNVEDVSPQLDDILQDDESPPEESFDPASVSLTVVLPPSLTQLAIVSKDNTELSSNITRLDWELRKVMLSPHFSDLEIIRLWRDQTLTKHTVGPDWEVQRESSCWKLSRRM